MPSVSAHICFSACTLRERLPRPEQGATPITSADYYRRAERDSVAYKVGNVDRRRRVAARFPGNVDVGGTVLLATSMRLEDFVTSRLVALAAHGVDVAITLARQPWTMPAAADAVAPTLVDLVGGTMPAELAWSSTDLLIAATGRRPLAPLERQHLGELADRFPLLS